jgi:hypothetical protein
MKFLIDECLSLALALRAHAAGYGESSHVVWLGCSGWKDWDLKPLIVDTIGPSSRETLSTSVGPRVLPAARASMRMRRSMPV